MPAGHTGPVAETVIMRMFRLVGVFLVSILALPAFAADSYPSRPVTLLVGGGPGSLPDIFARPLADRLSRALGRPFVVENKPGAGGLLAMQALKASPGDGHTLAMVTNAHAVWNPHIFATLPYDPAQDLVPVSPVATIPMALVVDPGLGVASVAELMALARDKPGTLNYASSGNGSPPHVLFEMLRAQAGVDMVHVPFRTGTDALMSVIAGDSHVYLAGTSLVAPMVSDGRLRLLAISEAAPGAAFEGAPTLADSGFPGLEGVVWLGVVASRGTDAAVIDTLNREIGQALSEPTLRHALDNQGALPYHATAAAFAERIGADRDQWDPVLARMGLRPD